MAAYGSIPSCYIIHIPPIRCPGIWRAVTSYSRQQSLSDLLPQRGVTTTRKGGQTRWASLFRMPRVPVIVWIFGSYLNSLCCNIES